MPALVHALKRLLRIVDSLGCPCICLSPGCFQSCEGDPTARVGWQTAYRGRETLCPCESATVSQGREAWEALPTPSLWLMKHPWTLASSHLVQQLDAFGLDFLCLLTTLQAGLVLVPCCEMLELVYFCLLCTAKAVTA